MVPLLGLENSGLAAQSVVLFGLGAREKFDAGPAFAAGVALGKKLAGEPRDTWRSPCPTVGTTRSITSALVEGLIVGTRGPDLRKAEPSRHPFETLSIVGPPDSPSDLRGGCSPGRDRRRGGQPGPRPGQHPAGREDARRRSRRKAKEVGESAGLSVAVWDGLGSRRSGSAACSASPHGSEEPPAFVILEHRKGGDAPTLALVGKGVTFDSGGLSLKPSASMEDMKSDMTGAAVVLASMVGDRPARARGQRRRLPGDHREHGQRPGDEARRRPDHAERQDGRGPQHRRRRAG